MSIDIKKMKETIVCENGGKHQVIYYTDAKKVIENQAKTIKELEDNEKAISDLCVSQADEIEEKDNLVKAILMNTNTQIDELEKENTQLKERVKELEKIIGLPDDFFNDRTK